MIEMIRVGMADLKASRHPSILTTLGLGSCVGILYMTQKQRLPVWFILCFHAQRSHQPTQTGQNLPTLE